MLRSNRSSALRGLRGVAVLAGVALGAATFMLPVAAQAQTTTPVSGLPTINVGHMPGMDAARAKKLPPNAIKATAPLPKVGMHGTSYFAPSGAHPNIVGGGTVNSSQYPYVVGIITQFIGFDSSGNPGWYTATCTGSIISPTAVLTAGHCDTELLDGHTVVMAGQSVLDPASTTSGFVDGVASTWTDPSFNLAALNAGSTSVPIDDVSVLTLSQPLPAAYTPVTLVAQGNNAPYATGTSATAIGYGVTSTTGTDSGTLRAVTLPIADNGACGAAMPGADGNRMTCGGVAAGGVGTCYGDSGGPLIINGAEAGITDWGSPTGCAAPNTYSVFEKLSYYNSAITASLSNPPANNLSFSGSGHSDILAEGSNGDLYNYSGSGFLNDGYNGFNGWVDLMSGWQGFSKLFRVTNWNGDGTESVFAETPSGVLDEYNSDGSGDLVTTPPVQVGVGFNEFTDIMVVPNWNNDGHENLIGRTPSGELRLYESDGKGGWINGNGVAIGEGFQQFNVMLTPGTWMGDGHQALIGRTASGELRLYENDGNGGWVNGNGVAIGEGWGEFSKFFSVGDWDGDGLVDLIGITPAGAMVLYTSNGHGGWINGSGIQINSGWNTFPQVF